MKRILIIGLGLVLAFGLVGLGKTMPAVPREGTPGVLLFDNGTGALATALILVLKGEVTVDSAAVFPIGGGEVRLFVTYPTTYSGVPYTYVFVAADVCPGGTLQVPLPLESSDAVVYRASWNYQ
jgi:hypothetical protein